MGAIAGLDRLILNLNRASYHKDPKVMGKKNTLILRAENAS